MSDLSHPESEELGEIRQIQEESSTDGAADDGSSPDQGNSVDDSQDARPVAESADVENGEIGSQPSEESRPAGELLNSPSPASLIVPLCELVNGQFADTFALLGAKEEAQTREGKPYFKVTFKDAKRSAASMIWSDHGLFESCRHWLVGSFYKLRCKYTENSYGPQVEIDRIRPVVENDREQGFDPDNFYAVSRYNRDDMFVELRGIVIEHVSEDDVKTLILHLLDAHEEPIKQHAAAARNHHAFTGGYLEHTLSVVKTALYLAEKYSNYYTEMQPPLRKSLVIAGAVLHDIGKLKELAFKDESWVYTAEGRLVGHILIGRDMVREAAQEVGGINPDTLLRIEHMIISHQNLPEWGSPIAPHTPEALLVHYADDIDAKFHELAMQLEIPWPDDVEFTSRKNPLRRSIFLGLNETRSPEEPTDGPS